ncbi:hypothetical protein FRB93_008057 [Tulasnella sp. JGI-2019a]|nr:hypothetical protein FRB93_008057 [Tulasnella sp. JGI-2019a]
MLQYCLYGGKSLPAGLQGVLKASANIDALVDQVLFGYLADSMGRKAVYGKELMLIMFATVMCLTVPTGHISPDNCLIYLIIFRVVLGIGVGGDYPMSASVSSDRANLRKRGTMLTYIFANQGWGSFVGAIVFIVVLSAYKTPMDKHGETSKVNGVWRICVGVSLIPCAATLYQRLTLPEATRYNEAQARATSGHGASDPELNKKHSTVVVDEKPVAEDEPRIDENATGANRHRQVAAVKKVQFMEFVRYLSEWRHAKILLGTTTCWFFLDIAFYGINLNQNVVLSAIGYDGKSGSTPWEKLFKLGVGNIIITALGFVPGYYATLLTVEYLGRKPIQLMGFFMEALFLGILAGKFHSLSHAAFIVNFALLQFFFNFGAITTTYLYPAEVFPTRFRAFAHGISAACGKAGAIISALVFNTLTNHIGTPNVLWIFFGCCIAGFFFTLLLPEVKGRDPDVVYEEELAEARNRRAL